MEENNKNLDPESIKEIEVAIAEEKMGNIRNNVVKAKWAKEMKGDLGEMMKNNPNKIERINNVEVVTNNGGFFTNIKGFFKNILKSF